MFVSNLSDSSITQLTEIQYAVFGGGVTLDQGNTTGVAVAGTDYPIGAPFKPSDNVTDAVAIIAAQVQPKKMFILGDATLTGTTPDLAGYEFVGDSRSKTTLTINPSANIDGVEIQKATVTGTLDGNSKLVDCTISALNYINGTIERCSLSAGVITLGGTGQASFLWCDSGVAGVSTPIIDCGGSGIALALRHYSGGVTLRNKTGAESVSIDLDAGQVILENTVTNGTIVVRGDGKVVDINGDIIKSGTWNGATIVNETTNKDLFAEAMWAALVSANVDVNSFGELAKRVLDILEADEEYTSTTAKKFLKGTLTELRMFQVEQYQAQSI
jgi:hypothetical protein